MASNGEIPHTKAYSGKRACTARPDSSMRCADCCCMVKEAVSGVEGVISASASMENRTAAVSLDGEAVNVRAITDATASICYEATLIGEE